MEVFLELDTHHAHVAKEAEAMSGLVPTPIYLETQAGP